MSSPPAASRPPVAASRSKLAGPRAVEARLEAELVQQRHVTVELQHAILPLHDEPFDLPGLRAVVRYLPASSASRVGGDWYITAEMPGGSVLLAIGDVAGHGLDAAAGMARLRGALAGLAITGASPERLVGEGGPSLWRLLKQANVKFIAIDEAHCISQWGHDFQIGRAHV